MRSVLNAALCLIVCLLCIAGIYILLETEFLAIVQILVYAGGILLLIIFGIMITRRHQDNGRTRELPAFLTGVVMLSLMWYALQDIQAVPSAAPDLKVREIGQSLMTEYAAPFEVGGILLLISMIGAMITSSFRSRT